MSDASTYMQRADQAVTAGRTQDGVFFSEQAISAAGSPMDKFEALLQRARAEVAGGELQKGLDTYWEARHLTKKHRLGRAGEADLGIGMMMLDLNRPGEGLEAVRRAVRYFRKGGNTFLRGCAETVLADEALKLGQLGVAESHLEVATDLIGAAGEPRMLSGVLTLRAEVLARQGNTSSSEALLDRAAAVARTIPSQAIQAELASRRRDVSALLGTRIPANVS